jgi:hypothetical protein
VSVSYYIQRGMVARSFVWAALLTVGYCLAVIVVSAGTTVAISMALGIATAPLFRVFLAVSKRDAQAATPRDLGYELPHSKARAPPSLRERSP